MASRTSPPASTARSFASRSAFAAAIAPFNFPAMVPMWFLPFALVCGNTFIMKPSEQVPISQARTFELLDECGLPRGRGQPRQRRPGSSRGDLRSPGHSRGFVRRIDPGGARGLSACEPRRQTRPGPRRREELRRRHAGRGSGPGDCHDHRVLLRLRGRALPRGERAAARRRCAQTGARPADRSRGHDEGRRRNGAGRADGPAHQRAPSRARARLHRSRRLRRRIA